ncbi:hypothetical protein JCM8097_005670 [Rhodosporidiobolus ruineniae]
MSSYLNKLPPPPPPPRASGSAPPAGSPPLDAASSSSQPAQPPTKRSHKHSQSTHWNDTPVLDFNAARPSGGKTRERVTSRVTRAPSLTQGSLQPTVEEYDTPSEQVTTSPLAGPTGKVLTGDAVLPAFNAPPPPPPEPVLSRRFGPRGLPADVLHFPPLISPSAVVEDDSAKKTTTKLVLVFVPGNPGLVGYYTFFLSSLRNALPSPLRESTEMYAIGHLGHSTAPRQGGGGFKPREQASLEEQVEDKVRFLEEIRGRHGLGEEGGARLVVLGHSIGAWVALQMLSHRPTLISSLHLLFPTLSHMALTPNGRALSPLFSSWTLRPVFYSTSALAYLPKALVGKLVGLITGHSGEGAQTTTALVSSPSTVLAALTMAREELASITTLDEGLVARAAGEGKLWIYYAAPGADGWVTEGAMEEVEAAFEAGVRGGRAEAERKRRVRRCEEGLPHAFVLDEAHSASLARNCSTWIVEDLAALDSSSSATPAAVGNGDASRDAV